MHENLQYLGEDMCANARPRKQLRTYSNGRDKGRDMDSAKDQQYE